MTSLQSAWHVLSASTTLASNDDMLVRLEVEEPERPHAGFIGHENIIGTRARKSKVRVCGRFTQHLTRKSCSTLSAGELGGAKDTLEPSSPMG